MCPPARVQEALSTVIRSVSDPTSTPRSERRHTGTHDCASQHNNTLPINEYIRALLGSVRSAPRIYSSRPTTRLPLSSPPARCRACSKPKSKTSRHRAMAYAVLTAGARHASAKSRHARSFRAAETAQTSNLVLLHAHAGRARAVAHETQRQHRVAPSQTTISRAYFVSPITALANADRVPRWKKTRSGANLRFPSESTRARGTCKHFTKGALEMAHADLAAPQTAAQYAKRTIASYCMREGKGEGSLTSVATRVLYS